MTTYRVITPVGYGDAVAAAVAVEVVEGCLIFSDAEGTVAVYSPGSWRMVIRESDGRAVA